MYRSNGKLILTGEYMVLLGARAIVLPLKPGQDMQVSLKGQDGQIKWNAYSMDYLWFTMVADTVTWTVSETTDQNTAQKLVSLLQEAGNLNPALFASPGGLEVNTYTGFKMEWGFGSSAALVANVAAWAGVDPFQLLFKTFGGSGADLAGALSDGPVVYRQINGKPSYCRIVFNPGYRDKLWLVYLGEKVDTGTGISGWNSTGKVERKHITMIDDLTLRIAEARDLKEFVNLIGRHEQILSELLEKPTVKELMFDDFPGEMKSLGTWGGDFALAVSEENETAVRQYFNSKGTTPIFSFNQIVL
ncbi:MAG TPA: GYDIA family GHMP kinase [Bacteroidales bacterium]|nr:GYDIA family GHMP kinase [Bacteroidales bacterium]